MVDSPAFVDTHVHLWDRRERDLGYAWLDGDGFPFGDLVAVRTARFSVPELRAEGRLAGLTKVVGRMGGLFFHTVGLENVPVALDLVRAHPETGFVLDQAGMPPDRHPETFEAWGKMLRALAAEPNTFCKVSSLGMVEPGWTPSSRRPWVLAPIEAFGADRVFFGSNWPVERLYSSYTDVVEAFRYATAGLTADERHAVMAGTAERVLRI